MDLTARLENDKRVAFRNGGGPMKSEAEEIEELMALGINHPARRRFRERAQRRKWEQLEKGWNKTPMRTRPPNLAGLRPITREPWAIDEDVYNRRLETRDVGVPGAPPLHAHLSLNELVLTSPTGTHARPGV